MKMLHKRKNVDKIGEHGLSQKINFHALIQGGCMIASMLIFFWFLSTVCLLRIVKSESMEPTITKTDFLLVNGVAYAIKTINRGDVIVFDPSNNIEGKEEDYVKRVIAVAGDTVSFVDGDVYVNGEPVDEEYVEGITMPTVAEIYTVPKNCVFCLGDNREHSLDSRYWDEPFLNINNIKGRVILSIGFSDDFHLKAF